MIAIAEIVANEEACYTLTDLQTVENKIDYSLPLMYDSETIGLYGKIRLVQFYQETWDKALIVEYPCVYTLMSILDKAIVVGHNVAYDISCIQEAMGKTPWMPEVFHDTFLLARLVFYKEEKFSLDEVIEYTIGINPYENSDLQKSDWNVPVLSSEQLEYAAKDVLYLLLVWNKCKDFLEDLSYKLDLLATRYCLDFQNNGMPVDIAKLEAKYIKNREAIAEIALPINCNSPKQVREYISSTMSDDLGLATLALQGNERARAVRATRKLEKSNSFLTKFTNTMEDGVIYGRFRVGARSGRLTSSEQNLQQLPRGLKGIFGVEEHGDTVIIYSDFAQIQLRCVCVKTADRAMEELFRTGKDLHNYVAAMTFGEAFTPEQRQIAKTENFGLLFGAGVNVFSNILIKAADIILPLSELAVMKKSWNASWKEITEWQQQGMRDWKAGRPWQTPLGRRYVARMMTDQLAMQIQGFESEVAKLALHYMIPKLRDLSEDIKLRNFIHDSYMFTCPNEPELYKQASLIIAESMQEAWQQMCQSVLITDLPMPVKVQVGFNWGDIEKSDGKDGKVIYELKI